MNALGTIEGEHCLQQVKCVASLLPAVVALPTAYCLCCFLLYWLFHVLVRACLVQSRDLQLLPACAVVWIMLLSPTWIMWKRLLLWHSLPYQNATTSMLTLPHLCNSVCSENSGIPVRTCKCRSGWTLALVKDYRSKDLLESFRMTLERLWGFCPKISFLLLSTLKHRCWAEKCIGFWKTFSGCLKCN